MKWTSLVVIGLVLAYGDWLPAQTGTGTGTTTGGTTGTTGATSGQTGGLAPSADLSSFRQGGNFAPTEVTATNTGSRTTPVGNPFRQYYANPLAEGFPGAATGTTISWGTPLYESLYTGQGAQTSTLLSSAQSQRFGAGFGGSFNNYNSTSILTTRTPLYRTVIERPARQTRPLAVRSPNLQRVIRRSSRLRSRDSVRVLVEGETVVLRGTVREDRERRLAENLLRLTPGVRSVRNELVVSK